MADPNLTFCRLLLRNVLAEVKDAFPDLNVRDAWVWKVRSFRNTWEFHAPGGFYWAGDASNAYEARFNGWSDYLRKHNTKA